MREKLTLLKTTRFVAVFAAAMLLVGTFVGSARAMVLTLDAGGIGDNISLPAFSLSAETGLPDGYELTEYSSSTAAGGLRLSGPALLKFEYLGSEAGDTNSLQVDSGGGFATVFTQLTPLNSIQTFSLGGDLVPFRFLTSGVGVSAENGGPFGGILQIVFADLTDLGEPGAFIALFGDGSGDNDHDDFAVKISVVPLPAAVWLFITAILGLVSVTRVRRQRSIA